MHAYCVSTFYTLCISDFAYFNDSSSMFFCNVVFVISCELNSITKMITHIITFIFLVYYLDIGCVN